MMDPKDGRTRERTERWTERLTDRPNHRQLIKVICFSKGPINKQKQVKKQFNLRNQLPIHRNCNWEGE